MGTHPIFESDFDCLTDFKKMVESQSDMVSDKKLKICLSALGKIMEAAKRKELWDEGEKLFAQITMHRIPSFPQEQNIRKLVPLVHSMWSDSMTKCLIVKDLDEKHEDTIDMTQELLKEHSVTGITKILPLDQLKKEHKGHELKRILSKEYDIFLADSRISRLAISHLGKEFYNRRKIPLCVNIDKTAKMAASSANLSVQLEKLSKSTQVIMTSRGANINIPFAHSLMSEEDQFDNLKSLVSQLNDSIPRGFKNIKVISLQGTGTKAIPLYRNDTVDPAVNELCGIELERKAGFEALMELRSEIEPKKDTKMGNGRKQKGKPKKKGKRKLMKAKLAPKNETDAPEAKKQKV